MLHPSDKHYCPLLKREIFYGGWGGCYEIQEYRDGNMDAEQLPYAVDADMANKACEKCHWYTGDIE